MPPHTTKRRTTPHLKTITTTTKKNENCQKIKLYGNLTTKELKKKHSFRQEGWRQAARVEKMLSKASHLEDWAGEAAAGGAGGPTCACR